MRRHYYALSKRPWITGVEGGCWGLPPGATHAIDLDTSDAARFVLATSDRPFDDRVDVPLGDGTPIHEYSATAAERQVLRDRLGVAYQAGWTLLDWLWSALTNQSDPDGQGRAKPIMPTHRGTLELHLCGGPLRSQRIQRDPTRLPSWKAMQRVLQNDYRKIREEARSDWRLGEIHKKWLGAQQKKYRLTPEAARDLIGDPRDGLPLRPTTTIVDDFDRDDGPPGPDWSIVGSSNWTIESNQIRGIQTTVFGGPTLRHNTALSSSDHYCQIRFVSGANIWSIMSANTRVPGDGSLTSYLAFVRKLDDQRSIRKMVDGVFTDLQTDAGGGHPPHTIRLVSDGSTHTLWHEGIEAFSVTDTEIAGGTHLALGAHSDTTSVAFGDDFIGADLLSAGGTADPRLIGGEAGYWPMDEGQGSVTQDVVGENDGTLTGDAGWVATPGRPSKFPNPFAVGFGPSQSNVGMTANLSSVGTVAVWGRASELNGQRILLSKSNDNDPVRLRLAYINDDEFYVAIGQTNNRTNGSRFLLDTWHHLAMSWNSGQAVVYFDGQQVDSFSYNGGEIGVTTLHLGSYAGSNSSLWLGAADDFRLFESVVGPEGIAILAAGGPAQGSPLIAAQLHAARRRSFARL